MKKVTYLLVLMFSLTLMPTSCEKDEPVVPEQTLEEKYPDWKNLTWVSTDGWSTPATYPQISIKITGNKAVLTVTDEYSDHTIGGYILTHDKFEVVGNIARFSEPETGTTVQELTILTPPDSTKIKVNWQEHTYVLKIN